MIFITRIPTHDNHGHPIAPELRQAVLDSVVLEFGGFSLDGPGEGAWVADDGTLYAEHS